MIEAIVIIAAIVIAIAFWPIALVAACIYIVIIFPEVLILAAGVAVFSFLGWSAMLILKWPVDRISEWYESRPTKPATPPNAYRALLNSGGWRGPATVIATIVAAFFILGLAVSLQWLI